MDTIEDNTDLLIEASEFGDGAEVERLIPISDPKMYSTALSFAVFNGHVECVKRLIPLLDSKACDNALFLAAKYGHTECVRLLIPVSDPKASDALHCAVINGHNNCVDLLFDVSDYDKVLDRLKKHLANIPERWQYLEDKIIAQRQRNMIAQEITVSSSVVVKQRKI